MSVRIIYPEKDASIYSEFPNKNTGIDEIIEIAAYEDLVSRPQAARGLIKFPTNEVNSILNSISNPYNVYLKLFNATSYQVPSEFNLECYPVSQSWEMGLGRFSNFNRNDDTGVTWLNRNLNQTWYITGSTFYTNKVTQSFVYNDILDLNINLTSILESGSDGFLIKLSSSLERQPNSNLVLKYFSKDTHTIYPPRLEFRIEDQTFINTESASVIDNNEMVVSLKNNLSRFNNETEKYRFRINVRDLYPARSFQTSSLYLNNKILPSSSYWSLIDYNTNDIFVDFGNGTEISADSEGSYFDIYLADFEPQRYYKILIKTNLQNGESLIIDNNFYFKLI